MVNYKSVTVPLLFAHLPHVMNSCYLQVFNAGAKEDGCNGVPFARLWSGILWLVKKHLRKKKGHNDTNHLIFIMILILIISCSLL